MAFSDESRESGGLRQGGLGRGRMNQHGVTYLMLMFAIVLMGVSLTAMGKQWSVAVKRDKEAELLFRGNRIKAAIEAYAAHHAVEKATRPNRYPISLEQLTKKPKRYLQVVYKDPITGQDFELIKAGGQIIGVKSTSKGKPFNKVDFKNASSYDQIAFQAVAPKAQPCLPGVSAINPLNPLGSVPCPKPGPSTTK